MEEFKITFIKKSIQRFCFVRISFFFPHSPQFSFLTFFFSISISITLFVAYNSFDSNALAIGYPALGDPARNLDANRLKKHYPFQFESIKEDYEILNTEILVIGSGAGGGVVSSELSSKGWKVLVVEKGLYLTPEELTGSPKDGLDKLYENGGLIATEDGALSLLAGSNFGGGTTVNWSASFRTGHYIREDWANNYGLTQFLSKDFSDSLEAVCDGMGVSTNSIKHSLPNQMLVDASKSLGYHVDNIPVSSKLKKIFLSHSIHSFTNDFFSFFGF